MGSGQPNGFDVVYEIGRDALLLRVLPKLLPFLSPNLQFPFDFLPRVGNVAVQRVSFAGLEHRGRNDVVLRVDCGLTLSGLGLASLPAQDYTVKLNDVLNTLRKIGAAFSVPPEQMQAANPGLGLDEFLLPGTVVRVPATVPVSPLQSVPCGNTLIGLPLTILTGARSGSQIPLTIGINPSTPVGGSAPGTFVPPLPGGPQDALATALAAVQLQALTSTIQTTVADAFRNRLNGFFPFQIPLVLPSPLAESCFIAPTAIEARVLQPSQSTNTMSFALLLREGAAGDNTANLDRTTLPAGNVDLSLGPSLLSKLVCCALSKTDFVLRRTPTSTTPTSCTWDNLGERVVSGERVTFERLTVSVGAGRLQVEARFRKVGWGFAITAIVRVSAQLQLEPDSTIVPVWAQPETQLIYEIEWWVWLIAAALAVVLFVIGWIVAVPILMVIGGITLAVEAILLAVFLGIVGVTGATLQQAFGSLPGFTNTPQLLPADLLERFGTVLPKVLTFDDLRLRGDLVFPPANAAAFVSQVVPHALNGGQQFSVSITMLNRGTRTWRSAGSTPHRLGSQNPQDNMTWGRNRADVASPTSMGSMATFRFNATAPATSGTYNFQWRMVQDAVQWFGAHTPNIPIRVTGKDNKDNKDNKDQKDGKDGKDSEKEFKEDDKLRMIEQVAPLAAERTGTGPAETIGGPGDEEVVAPEVPPEGRAFISPDQRPAVGEEVIQNALARPEP